MATHGFFFLAATSLVLHISLAYPGPGYEQLLDDDLINGPVYNSLEGMDTVDDLNDMFNPDDDRQSQPDIVERSGNTYKTELDIRQSQDRGFESEQSSSDKNKDMSTGFYPCRSGDSMCLRKALGRLASLDDNSPADGSSLKTPEKKDVACRRVIGIGLVCTRVKKADETVEKKNFLCNRRGCGKRNYIRKPVRPKRFMCNRQYGCFGVPPRRSSNKRDRVTGNDWIPFYTNSDASSDSNSQNNVPAGLRFLLDRSTKLDTKHESEETNQKEERIISNLCLGNASRCLL